MDQLHQQIAVDAVAFLRGGLGELGGVLGEIDRDDLVELLVPEFLQWLLVGEARRQRLRRLGRSRYQGAAGDRADGACRADDEVASIDLVF